MNKGDRIRITYFSDEPDMAVASLFMASRFSSILGVKVCPDIWVGTHEVLMVNSLDLREKLKMELRIVDKDN